MLYGQKRLTLVSSRLQGMETLLTGLYKHPMQQKTVSFSHLAAGETHACLESPLWSFFKQFLFGMLWPGATSQHISIMSKKGPAAFTSTQTSYMETNAGRDQVQVRIGTCFHESSSWNELVSFTLLLHLLWDVKALKLLNTLVFQPFTKRAPSHSALQGCAQFGLSRRWIKSTFVCVRILTSQRCRASFKWPCLDPFVFFCPCLVWLRRKVNAAAVATEPKPIGRELRCGSTGGWDMMLKCVQLFGICLLNGQFSFSCAKKRQETVGWCHDHIATSLTALQVRGIFLHRLFNRVILSLNKIYLEFSSTNKVRQVNRFYSQQ